MQTILGIDIGTYSIKVAEIRRSFNAFHFSNFYERRIQYSEVLTREESIATALQGVLEDNALTWDVCFTALPDKSIATRLVTLPFANSKRVAQTVAFEIEDLIPFGMDEVVYDYHIATVGIEESQVLVFYARNADIAEFLTFINAAGVDPRRLCSGGVELVNLVHIGMQAPEAPFALVDLGHETTKIVVCDGKKLIFMRTIAIGGQQLTQAVAKAVDSSEEEAERLKVELGHVTSGDLPSNETLPDKVTIAISAVVEDLLIQIKQTFFAYREQTGQMLEGIYLCGGTSRLSGLDEYLSVNLQQNVTFMDCHDFHFTRVERSEVPREIAAGALGLALRGVATTGLPDIDFRQADFKFKVDTQQLGGKIRGLAVAMGVVLLLGAVYFGMRWYSLNNQIEQRHQEIMKLAAQALPKNQLAKINDASGAVRALQASRKNIQKEIDILQGLTQDSVLESFKRFSSAIPSREDIELNVNEFNYSLDQIRIEAETRSSSDLDQLKSSIEKNLTKHKDGKRDIPPADGKEALVVEFPGARAGTKGELKFDIMMKTAAAQKREADKKQNRRRRR